MCVQITALISCVYVCDLFGDFSNCSIGRKTEREREYALPQKIWQKSIDRRPDLVYYFHIFYLIWLAGYRIKTCDTSPICQSRVSITKSAYVRFALHTCVRECVNVCLEYVIVFYIAMIMRKIVWELDAESATFYMLLASYCRRPTREEKSIPLSLRLQHTKEWKIQRSVFFFNAPMFASSTTNETNSLPPRFQQWRDEKKEKILGKGTCKIHFNKINCVLEFRLKLVTYFSVNRLDLTQKKRNPIEMKFQ